VKRNQVIVGALFTAMLCSATLASAQTAPSLGAAQSYTVLGGQAVTNTGTTTVTGDLGVSPGISAPTGFPPGVVVGGAIHSNDASAIAAQSAVGTAYTNLVNQACTQDLTGQDLGGKILTPGVYCFSSSAQLTGTLTLNAQGNAAAVFIFKIGSTLTTASGSRVVMANGGSLCNVFWQVGSSATLGTATMFGGNILAQTSITLTTGAQVTGRALARTGAVTLDTNNVSSTCAVAAVCPVISVTPTALANATVGVAFTQTLTASGGAAPNSFTVTSGTLPAGLTLSSTGVLSGTPTTAGTASFTIRGADSAGCFTDQAFTLITATPVPTLPQVLAVFLALGLAGLGYIQLRRREQWSATQTL